MSGGHLHYFYSTLEEHVGDFGDKELDELVADLAELFHDREWYLSGDTGVGGWNEARDDFKEKRFTKHGRQKRIEKYLEEFANEVRQSFGLDPHYCERCIHWAGLEKHNGIYGNCVYNPRCLRHRCDSCEKWEKRE